MTVETLKQTLKLKVVTLGSQSYISIVHRAKSKMGYSLWWNKCNFPYIYEKL